MVGFGASLTVGSVIVEIGPPEGLRPAAPSTPPSTPPSTTPRTAVAGAEELVGDRRHGGALPECGDG
jgi:hypothetical protein